MRLFDFAHLDVDCFQTLLKYNSCTLYSASIFFDCFIYKALMLILPVYPIELTLFQFDFWSIPDKVQNFDCLQIKY